MYRKDLQSARGAISMLVGVFMKNSAYFYGGYKEEKDTALLPFLLELPVMTTDR